MFSFWRNLFKKNPAPVEEEPKKTFIKDQRIRIPKRIGARNKDTDEYCSIEGDMTLIFDSEDETKLFFLVRCSFMPCNSYEAKDGDIVYFTKKNFIAVKYERR